MKKPLPPLTPEQIRMQTFHTELLAKQGSSIGWGRDTHSDPSRFGQYFASYARDAWAAWQEAQK